MAGSKVLQFCLLISLMIFSTHALRVFLTEGRVRRGLQLKTKIHFHFDEKHVIHYDGCTLNKTYTAGPYITKVIVYVRSQHPMFRTTLKECHQDFRMITSDCLRVHNIELLYLAVYDFINLDERLIGEFLRDSIKPYPGQTDFQINTLGVGKMNMNFETTSGEVKPYQEDGKIFEGNLRGHLESIESELCLTHLLSDDLFDGAESIADTDSE